MIETEIQTCPECGSPCAEFSEWIEGESTERTRLKCRCGYLFETRDGKPIAE